MRTGGSRSDTSLRVIGELRSAGVSLFSRLLLSNVRNKTNKHPFHLVPAEREQKL